MQIEERASKSHIALDEIWKAVNNPKDLKGQVKGQIDWISQAKSISEQIFVFEMIIVNKKANFYKNDRITDKKSFLSS